MVDLLYLKRSGVKGNAAVEADGLAVRQPVFLDVVAVGLEQDLGATVLTHLLGASLDHAVAFAGLLVQDLAGSGNFEALFGA
jgi:hypothetical protein